ncbi:MAG: hypothetical protein QS748_05930 [Candidatus Endonucleobacter bathymodioli]|uniref:Uncharacterized protein n=1 Tax=Candidatus Endonucleibacter bathymodioli TaxID=539814 RepID=A0AA90NL59_9GAMM|nr:hypothetical protein [Candidatus Endonucleobacter bathymodioli]
MTMITTKNADNSLSNTSNALESITPVSKVDMIESDRFAKLANSENGNEVDPISNDNSDEMLTLQELQQQFMDSSFRAGFNRTMEKAKEIIKEMKE